MTHQNWTIASMKTKIPWIERTWNPVTGCSPRTNACINCYAMRLLRERGLSTEPRFHPSRLDVPLKRKKPTEYFFCSMGDFFAQYIPEQYVFNTLSIVRQAHWHRFVVLTKCPSIALMTLVKGPVIENLGVGITAWDDSSLACAVRYQRLMPTNMKFISLEPLLSGVYEETVRDACKVVDWIIVGGETGPNARPMIKSMPPMIESVCKEMGVPYFFKQWGDADKHKDVDYTRERPSFFNRPKQKSLL